MAKRHNGKYDKSNSLPFEISRSKIDLFFECPACFYLEKVLGIKRIDGPKFTLNETTDHLFKRDFDNFRGKDFTHPYLINKGFDHLVPFEHEDLSKWRRSTQFGADGYFNTVHEETNLKVGGGLDDIFQNKNTKELHVVDYKSKSTTNIEYSEITLDGKFMGAYKRQMDFYVWVLRRKGFSVSDIGYFLYCDGDRFTEYTFLGDEIATMQFKMTLLPYHVDTSWIEPCLKKIEETLHYKECPAHNETCKHGNYLAQINLVSID